MVTINDSYFATPPFWFQPLRVLPSNNKFSTELSVFSLFLAQPINKDAKSRKAKKEDWIFDSCFSF